MLKRRVRHPGFPSAQAAGSGQSSAQIGRKTMVAVGAVLILAFVLISCGGSGSESDSSGQPRYLELPEFGNEPDLVGDGQQTPAVENPDVLMLFELGNRLYWLVPFAFLCIFFRSAYSRRYWWSSDTAVIALTLAFLGSGGLLLVLLALDHYLF